MGTRLLDTDVLIEIRAKLLFDESHLPGSYAHRLAHSHWSLDLSGDHRFSASWGACLGGSAHEGAWRLEGDVLILEPDPPCDLDDLHGMATRYIPVWWGNRHLLVTEIQIPALCADARGKAPPQEARVNGLYLVKVLASGAPAGMGAPVVPKRFRHFYESGPIRAQVVRVNDDGTVTLDKGSDDRLQVGMWLTIGWFRDDIEAEVISVSEHSAVARAYYSQRSERRIAPGERLTTGERGQYPLHAARERLTEPPPPRPRITIRHKDTGAILQRFYAPTEDQALHISGDLQGADLREAGPGSDAPLNLVGAVGWFAHLQGAVMEGQNLAEAGFHCGKLEGANARSANLEGADLSDANLRRIILAGANLTDANLQKSDLTDADLSGAGLCRALLG